jgi:ribonucleoside-diphosphate reductase alpha chain
MIEKVEKMLISNTNNITPELDTTDVEDTSDDESCGNSCATCSMTSTCNKVNEAPQVATNPGAIRVCPECGKEVEHEGGCVVCRNCGYSKCG